MRGYCCRIAKVAAIPRTCGLRPAPRIREPASGRGITASARDDYAPHVVRETEAAIQTRWNLQPRRTAMPFVTADDGAQIFYKDWGTAARP